MNASVTLTAGTVVTVKGVEFCLCADVDANPAVPVVVYPRLLWSPSGEEVTVENAEDEADKLAGGYRLTAAATPVVPAPPRNCPNRNRNPRTGRGDPQDASFGADAKAKKGGKKK